MFQLSYAKLRYFGSSNTTYELLVLSTWARKSRRRDEQRSRRQDGRMQEDYIMYIGKTRADFTSKRPKREEG